MSELRTAAWFALAAFVLLGLAFVSLHEKHYARRHLIMLESRVKTIEKILTEDRIS